MNEVVNLEPSCSLSEQLRELEKLQQQIEKQVMPILKAFEEVVKNEN